MLTVISDVNAHIRKYNTAPTSAQEQTETDDRRQKKMGAAGGGWCCCVCGCWWCPEKLFKLFSPFGVLIFWSMTWNHLVLS